MLLSVYVRVDCILIEANPGSLPVVSGIIRPRNPPGNCGAHLRADKAPIYTKRKGGPHLTGPLSAASH